jgi:hypothetical protein
MKQHQILKACQQPPEVGEAECKGWHLRKWQQKQRIKVSSEILIFMQFFVNFFFHFFVDAFPSINLFSSFFAQIFASLF